MTQPTLPQDPRFLELARRAAALHRQGQFQGALTLAEQLSAAFPPSPPLLSLAGTAANSLGLTDKAEHYFRQALALSPDYAIAHANLGLVLKASGRLQQAEASFRKALDIQPDDADVWVNLGNLLRATGQIGPAQAAYEKALAYAPDHAGALYNLGLLLVELGRPQEAEKAFRHALRLRPDWADVHNELGNLLADGLRFTEADAAYRQAISLDPNHADAHFNLGVLLKDSHRDREAAACLERAIAIQPEHADALNCLGNLFVDQGRPQEAEAAYRRALALKPGSANVHNNLGNLLMASNRLGEAEAAFRQAVALEPGYGHALGQAVTCARRRYAWAQHDADERAIIAAIDQGVEGIPALMVQSLAGTTPELRRKAAELTAIATLRPYLARPPLIDPSLHRSHARLRIGYLSADFREHAVMHLMAGILSRHDKERYAIYGYSYGPYAGDAYRSRIEASCEHFHELRGLDNLAAAQRIAADEIDILVDLTGHTGDTRPAITALRPAPVIVSWLGFPGTLGIARLADYIIGDSVLTPLDAAAHYSETLAWMPHCYQPNDDALEVGEAPARQEVGLPREGVVFCSFNQGYKLTPTAFSVWCRLLTEVEGSVLWLLAAREAEANENLRQEARARGVAPERLVFAPHLPIAAHLARLQLADLALDTFPYGSGATGSNLLRSGVPLVTLQGEAYVSRMAASQLHALGVPELVAQSWEQYFTLARQLATEPERRRALRARMQAGRTTSPLFDTRRFTRDLERLYDRIWQQQASGLRAPITT